MHTGILLEVSDVAWPRFAWQAWQFVTFQHVSYRSKVILCGRRSTFASLSEDELQFSWQAQHFGDLHRHFTWQAQHCRRVASRVFYEPHCFDAPTCLVSGLWFSSSLAVSLGKLQNLSWLTVSKQVVMWFCVAGLARPDILRCLQTCRKSFCGAGAILLRRFQKMSCIFCGRRSTLETSMAVLRGRRSIWFRSFVCGMLFREAGAVFRRLHTLHFTL